MENNELYHYGVLGMKWGHRKNASIAKSNNAYKKARKNEQKAVIGRLFKKETYLAGYENQQKNKKNKANINRLGNIREKAAFDLIDKKAKYAYNEKLAKTGDKHKAEKASMKVHAKAMSRTKYGSGLVGSYADKDSKGGNTRYYKHMMATKGKKYASNVEKIYGKKINKQLAASAAVLVGLNVVPAVIDRINRG